jgi:hypothetical protein
MVESVAESRLGTNLYVLNLDSSQVSQIVASSAGNIQCYTIGSDGGLALAGTTTISNGLPTSMVALPAN